MLLTLVFTMITCMILGMGLPSIPSYLITATIAAPALVELGQPELAAHLFCFYFAMFANLTPCGPGLLRCGGSVRRQSHEDRLAIGAIGPGRIHHPLYVHV